MNKTYEVKPITISWDGFSLSTTYAVINKQTGIAQSTWRKKLEADKVAKDLNKPMFRAGHPAKII